MLFAGQLLLERDQARCGLVPGAIRVRDDVIVEVIDGEMPSRFDVGGPDHIITPGFIDAHLHLPQFDIIGGHGMPLLQWLNEVTFPSERRWDDVDFAQSMASRVFKQCLRHGTTSICAYATVHHQSALAALALATDLGMGGTIGQVLMDREAPGYLCREANELIDQCQATLERYPSSRRMSAAVTPRFAISCTPELLAASGELAKQHHAFVQTHLAETVAECGVVSELFDNETYVNVYKNAGLVTPRSIFGHGIHLDETDRSQLALAGGMVAHCPTANSFLRSGTMNRMSLMTDRVHVLLGSDIGAGYERSMVRVARAMIEAASSLGECYPSPDEAWHSITAGNADRLGFSDLGKIQAGKSADIVIVKPDIPLRGSSVNPLSTLMFAWDDRWIEQVYLRGKRVV